MLKIRYTNIDINGEKLYSEMIEHDLHIQYGELEDETDYLDVFYFKDDKTEQEVKTLSDSILAQHTIADIVQPTEQDKLQAQVIYTAMMTDTLLEEV